MADSLPNEGDTDTHEHPNEYSVVDGLSDQYAKLHVISNEDTLLYSNPDSNTNTKQDSTSSNKDANRHTQQYSVELINAKL